MSAMSYAHGEWDGQGILPAMRVEPRRGGKTNTTAAAAAACAGDGVRRAADPVDFHRARGGACAGGVVRVLGCTRDSGGTRGEGENTISVFRSEERRVGKECIPGRQPRR